MQPPRRLITGVLVLPQYERLICWTFQSCDAVFVQHVSLLLALILCDWQGEGNIVTLTKRKKKRACEALKTLAAGRWVLKLWVRPIPIIFISPLITYKKELDQNSVREGGERCRCFPFTEHFKDVWVTSKWYANMGHFQNTWRNTTAGPFTHMHTYI